MVGSLAPGRARSIRGRELGRRNACPLFAVPWIVGCVYSLGQGIGQTQQQACSIYMYLRAGHTLFNDSLLHLWGWYCLGVILTTTTYFYVVLCDFVTKFDIKYMSWPLLSM
jgi:hypothetical protein